MLVRAHHLYDKSFVLEVVFHDVKGLLDREPVEHLFLAVEGTDLNLFKTPTEVALGPLLRKE